MPIIAYEKNGKVYYDYGYRRLIYVADGSFVSVSGNFIVYKKNNGHIYKAEVNQNGYICRRDIYVG